MNNLIMQALATGTAELIKSLFTTMTKKGALIMLLFSICAGLLFSVIQLLQQADQMRREFKMEIKQELADARNEYRKEIADLNLRVEACEDERIKLKVRVAQLERKR